MAAFSLPCFPHRKFLRYLVLAFLIIFSLWFLPAQIDNPLLQLHHQHPIVPAARCYNDSITKDVFVAVKAGATELRDRLPLPLSSMLTCIDNLTIFSDYEETFSGIKIVDALDEVDPNLRNNHQDFEIYRKLQQQGPGNLSASDLTVKSGRITNGKSDNAGWVLDKWKFLPIVDKMVRMRPDAKWYVLVETDTYINWPNMYRWLSWLDSSKPEYVGFPMQLGPTIFAYGGSGILMSNPAARKCSEYHMSHIAELNDYTDREWAGDSILGKVMLDAGVPLHGSWPLSYTESIADVEPTDRSGNKRLWCHPLVSMHHMEPEETRDLWNFEQRWERNNTDKILLFQDLFREYILPQMNSSRDSWDNNSKDLVQNKDSLPKSFKECEEVCKQKPSCLQFSYSNAACHTSDVARLGRVAPADNTTSIRSGWFLDRIQNTLDRIPSCEEDYWV